MFIRLKDGHFLNLDHVLSVEKQTNGDVTAKLAVPRQHTDVVTETFKGEAAANLLDALEGRAYTVHKEPLVPAKELPTPTVAADETSDQAGGSAAKTQALGAGSLTGTASGQTGKEGGDLNLNP